MKSYRKPRLSNRIATWQESCPIINFGSRKGCIDKQAESPLSTVAPASKVESACDCWQGFSISISHPPEGFSATTPLVYDLTADDQTFYFGFSPNGTVEPLIFDNEPDWSQQFSGDASVHAQYY